MSSTQDAKMSATGGDGATVEFAAVKEATPTGHRVTTMEKAGADRESACMPALPHLLTHTFSRRGGTRP